VTLQYSLAPDPYVWGSNISPDQPEPDDDLHNPDPRRDRKNDAGGSVFTYRGLANVGCLTLLLLGLVTLLYVFSLIFGAHYNDEVSVLAIH